MRKICIFTGSRAEYGLQRGVIPEIQADRNYIADEIIEI